MTTIWPYISKIHLKNWSSLEIERNDIIVFVWANNCWKSTILKEIDWSYANSNKTWWQKIVEKIDISNDLDDDRFISLIKDNSRKKHTSQWNTLYEWLWYSIIWDQMDFNFDYRKTQSGNYCKVFSSILSTKERLSMMDKKIAKKNGEKPTEIYHIYWEDSKKFNLLKEYFRDVFWKELSYYPQYHWAETYFKVSDSALSNERYGEDWFNDAFVKYNEAGDIDEQWDWMKSYTWIAASLIAWCKNTYYIDEPESFLHPPQAYYMGQQIGELSDWQIFLATHSQDFIKWLLKANSNRVKIYRILRNENENKLIEINKSDLLEIQNDAFLHYSNFLDSLFNNYTIICEDQSDCLFYNRIIDILYKERQNEKPSINYVYTWWKWNFPRIYKLSEKRWINFWIIWDIDVLDDFNLLKNILREEKVSKIAEDYNMFYNFINKLRTISIQWSELKKMINDEIHDDEQITKDYKNKINNIINELKKPRDQFKSQWINIFWDQIPEYFTNIMNFLKEKNIFLVPYWEMEDLIPEIKQKKQKFVYEAITLNENDEKLNKAKEFLWEIVDKI